MSSFATSPSSNPKIALFGGTFNPPHKGHVHVVRLLAKRFDEVWIVVASDPNKKEKPYVPPEHRFKMAELAFLGRRGISNVKVLDVELKRSGVSYTLDTVRQLQADFPLCEFWWVMGSDLLLDFPRWSHAENLSNLLPFLLVHRPGYALDAAMLKLFARADVLEGKGVDASSTQLRLWLSSGFEEKVKSLLPRAVFSYINLHHLYSDVR